MRALEGEKLPVLTLPEGKAELGAALGLGELAAVAVCDLGFACAVAEKLAETEPSCGAVCPGAEGPAGQSAAPEGGHRPARQKVRPPQAVSGAVCARAGLACPLQVIQSKVSSGTAGLQNVCANGKRRHSRPGFPIGTSSELQEVAILICVLK